MLFLYPGHVNAITGTELCEDLTEEGVSGVVAGFTAKELLTALAVALVKFQEGKPFLCKLLSASCEAGRKPGGAAAYRRNDRSL